MCYFLMQALSTLIVAVEPFVKAQNQLRDSYVHVCTKLSDQDMLHRLR